MTWAVNGLVLAGWLVGGAGFLADLADALPGDAVGFPQPLERRVGDIGEAVLQPEVVQLLGSPHIETQPLRSPDGVRSVGVPATTSSHSSSPKCQWYGQRFSPGPIS